MLDNTQAIDPQDDGPDSGELPAYAPPPPVVKPTIASLLVEWLKTLDYGVRQLDVNMDDLYAQSARSLAQLKMFMIGISIALFLIALIGVGTLAAVFVLVGYAGR